MAPDIPRRLVAIVAADIASYTRLMEFDEAGTVAAWRRARAEVIEPTVAKLQGRIVKLTGDGFLAEFPTVESAVRAALAMQDSFAGLLADMPEDDRISFRMGVNVGDVWVDADDIYGAGVNIAARLEALAEPGGLCVSGAVYDEVKHKIAAQYEDMGVQRVKNVAEPIHAWRMRSRGAEGHVQSSDAAFGFGRFELPPLVAWPLLGFVLIGMLVVAMRNGDVSQVKPSMLSLPPEVLTERAREILATAGHDGVRADSESWFIAELPSEESRRIANAPIRAIRFIYRESPSYLVPQNLFRFVTQDDPAPSLPGMASVTMDTDGNLLRLDIVSGGMTAQTPPFSNWAELFEAAGLNLEDVHEIAPYRPAPVPRDRQVAWIGRDGTGAEVFVTAAVSDGRPGYFEASPSGSPAAYRAAGPFFTGSSTLAEANLWFAVIVAFGAAALMARYNLRRGQGDRTHAKRIAVFFVVVGVLSSVVRGHHVPVAIEETTFLFSITGWSLIWGAFVWLMYIGLEPHARRVWPRTLVSWRRLMSGRWRDPVVGRDVLVGIAVGVALVAARLLFNEPQSNDLAIRALESLRSVPAFVHAVLLSILDVPSHALAALFFLLLMRGIFRNTWVAAFVACIAFLPYVSQGTAFLSWELGAYALFATGAMVTVLLRLGVVAHASSLLAVFFLTRFPLTVELNAWYFELSTLILLFVGLLASYGCVVALGPGMLSPDATARRTSR